jgi:hypothetical protein
MGNILNKMGNIGLILNMPDHINRCLGIISVDKKDDIDIDKKDCIDKKAREHIHNEHSDYDIVDRNEIYPYTFSKQNK